MTVAIALQVHDGVVIASDSAGTLNDPSKAGADGVLNVYHNSNKIYNLRKGLPIGSVVYGMGSIGSSSISTLAKDLRRRFSGEDPSHIDWTIDDKSYTIENVALKAREFIFDECFKPLNVSAPGVQFGMMIAGYSSGAQLSEVWSIEIANGDCAPPNLVLPQGIANVLVGGDPEVFGRLSNGHSPALPVALAQVGLDQATIATVMSAAATLCIPLVEAPMPIQDAIDLAEFYVNTTALFAKFRRGAATVGGPTESAAITKHEGFKWVHRKHYFNEAMNPGDRHD